MATLKQERGKASQVETMRLHVKSSIQSALFDGRLSDIIARVNHEKKAEQETKARESLRLSVRSTLQEAVCDGSLAKTIAVVKQEREVATRENLRQNLRQTFTAAVLDGRLSGVIAKARQAKKAKEAEHLRQTMKETLQIGVLDGRLVTIMTAMKEKKQAQELHEMRQSVKQTLQSSLIDGRLSKVIATLRADKDVQELEDMRQRLQHNLQASLDDGRLSAVIASVAEKRRAQEIEAMRQSMQLTLRTSLLNGRLSEVVSHVYDERKIAQAVAQLDAISSASVNAPPISGPTPTPTPAKPTSAKTASRPTRRHASRNAASADKQVEISSGAESLLMSVPLPPLKASALPPRPRTPSSRLKAESSGRAPAQNVCESSLAQNFDLFNKRAPSPRAALPKLSRPASSDCMLPPVTPPSRKPTATLAARLVQSAMSLDLGIACGVPLDPSMPLGLGQDLMGGHVQQTSHSRSSSKLRVSKMTLKQGPSFLPPIVGVKALDGWEGKSTTHKRSASVDSFMWGVAPLIRSHTEWDVVGQLVL